MNDTCILTASQGILQAIRFPDLIFRASQRVDDLVTLVNVDHIMDNGISIALHGYFRPLGLKRGSYYRLYKRYVDYNSDKVLTGLKNMDNMGRETTFEVTRKRLDRHKIYVFQTKQCIRIEISSGSEWLG